MQIYIFGDLEFAYFILNGVTMLFSGDSSYIQAALILSLLFLMWSFIKWSMNPEKTPYPVREFSMGILFFLIFGGTAISPKFQVTLISASNGTARIVTDVPFLAAVPSWLATNLFKGMTDTLENGGFFVIPGYENLRNYGIPSESQTDPLTALVQLYKLANTRIVDRRHELNISNYLTRCYTTEKQLTNLPMLDFQEAPLFGNFISHFAVINPNLTMDYHNSDGSSGYITCPAAFILLQAEIHTTSAPTSSSINFSSEAMTIALASDISPTALGKALKTINDSLTGASTSPDPFTFTSNLFFATKVKDHLANDTSTISLWSEKMVFEAERKRTAEAVGDRSLFIKIYIPTITAIECFSFFIAPVLMILSILGGYGFSLIGKYLMLVLFINLWSFIKVFVDVITALTISKAFKNVTSATEDQHPFSFQNYANSIMEVESMLTVAANLTVAIPFFAMFLLYGGVHSVMGVMRTVTGGSVDGNNMAPTMSTTMNNGAWSQGDTTNRFVVSTGNQATGHDVGTNALYGTQAATGTIGSSHDATAQTLSARQQAATQVYEKSFTQLAADVKQSINQRSSGETQTAGRGSSSQNMFQLIDQESAALSDNSSRTVAALANFMAVAGASAAIGTPGKTEIKPNPGEVAAGADPSNSTGDAKGKTPKKEFKDNLMRMGFSASGAAQIAGSLNESQMIALNKVATTTESKARQLANTDTFNIQDANAELETFSKALTDSQSLQNVNKYGQQITDLNTAQAALSTGLATAAGVTSSNPLAFNTAKGFDNVAFTKWYGGLDDTQKERLGSTGLKLGDNAFAIASEISKSTGTDHDGFHGAFVASHVLGRLNRADENFTDAKTDADIAGSLYRELAKHAGPVHGAGFNAAADVADMASATAGKLSKFDDKNNIKTPDTSRAEGAKTVADGSPIAKPTDNTDQTRAQNKAAPGLQTGGTPTQITGPDGGLRQHFMSEEEKKNGIEATQAIDNSSVANLLSPVLSLGKSIFSGLDNLTDMFKGRSQLWGHKSEDISNNLGAMAAKQYGVQSGVLAEGLKDVTNQSLPNWNQLFKDLNEGTPVEKNAAAQTIARMNDARLFLNTKEGLSAALDAFSPEDGQRLVQNMQQLEKYLGARTESETPFSESFFNGISQARMSGALTDTQAETALKVVAGAAQGENVTESRYGATQSAESDDMRNAKSLSWVLNASDSTFKDTPEAMAVNNAITATDKAGNYMNYYAPASKADDYRQDAVQDFLSDGQAHAHRAGAMQGDGSFVPGYNFAPSEDNISQAPMQYAQELLRSNQTPEDFNISKLIDATDQQTPASFLSRVFSWGKQAPTLETDKQEKLHTAAYVPHEIYQPLINAGLTQEGGRIKDGVEHLRAVAPSYSVSISTEVLENDYKEVKQGLEGLPSISDVFKKP